MTLTRLLPRRADYAGLSRSWKADVVAGVTVGVVALPLALGFGITTGLGARTGLMTAIIAGVVAAVFGGSNVQVSGPTGAMTVVLVPIVAREGANAVYVVGIMAGVLLVVAAFFRLGRYLAYVPWPVIEGFTVGIAAIIFLQQVPAALGVPKPKGDNTALVAIDALRHSVAHGSLATLSIVVLVAIVMTAAPRLHKSLPGSLLAVAIATLVARVADLDVARIGTLPSSLPLPSLPSISASRVSSLAAAAFAVALLAGLESLLSAKVADGMADAPRHDPDRELFGQGLANLASPLFGGMPATGAIARTAVNVRAGARTRASAIVHSLVLVAVVYFGGTLVAEIPLAALAGVLMVTAVRMVEIHNVRAVCRATRSDAIVLVLTAAATVAFDLIRAVEIGVAVAAFLALRKVALSTSAIAEGVPTEATEITGDDEHALLSEHIVTYRLDGALFFGAAQRFLTELTSIADVRVVILRLPQLQVLDATGAQALGDIVTELERRGATVLLKGPRPEHLKVLEAVGALDRLAHENHVFADLDAAIAHAHLHVGRGPALVGFRARVYAESALNRRVAGQSVLKGDPRRDDPCGMDSESGVDAGCHFAGLNTWLLIRYLRDHVGPHAPEQLLREAGETRTVADLSDFATWSSYDQVRRLFEVTAASFGGPETLRRAASSGLADPSMPELADAMQSLGSPEALLEMITASRGASVAPVIGFDAHAVGPTEWLVHEKFDDGFAPFREYCAWASGLYTNIPMLFGLRAEVVKEACACDGAPACEYRLRWFPDEAGASTEFLESRIEVLTARLESLHETVRDLVSEDDLERVLDKIVRSAAHSIHAPIFVLALESLPSAPKNVYAKGVDDAHAERLAVELLEAGTDEDEQRIVVDVKSSQRRYGRLAAINPGGVFFPQERVVLQAYARLAAAALDSASALDDARRQARTARALLDLSNSLAQLATTDDMAANIVRALPAVIGCDRAAVALFEPGAPHGRVVATTGYTMEQEVRLRSMEVPVPAPRAGDTAVTVWDRESAAHLNVLPMLMDELGAAAVATIPIIVNEERVGLVVGDVMERPERMIDDPELAGRLRGVASQATIAIRNARLLEGIRHQALHDSLTGLPNRTLILDRVEQMQARARRTGSETAALFLDLDGFKQVNDTLGHEAGDQLLKAVAARLLTTLREGDTIARLGGDEFVVLVEGATPTGSPEMVAERLLEVMREPFEIADIARPIVRVTASIGIARGNKISATDLLRDADIALYEAKAAGRDRYVTFQREMQTAVEDRLTLELDLRGALDRNEYFLVYQPIFELETGAPLGVEALLRWQHPVRGLVQPDAFIPLLEETKLIVDVGRWVINEAARQAQEWRLGDRNMYVSVNVSARQLDGDHLVRDLRTALDATGLPPSALVIELTETAIMYDANATALQLRAIKDLGVGVAIDDFGTGYSSLAYLRQFPVDILKIDRSFVSAISDSAESSALIRTLVQLGKQLGLKTLAEGIEEHDQFCQLQQEQCDSGQGFMFARPLAADAVQDFLAALPNPAAPMPEPAPAPAAGT